MTPEEEQRLAELMSYYGHDQIIKLPSEPTVTSSNQNQSFLGDIESLGHGGFSQGMADTTGGLGLTFLEDWFQEEADEQYNELTEETQLAMSNLGIIDDTKEFTARGMTALSIQSLGQMASFMGWCNDQRY